MELFLEEHEGEYVSKLRLDLEEQFLLMDFKSLMNEIGEEGSGISEKQEKIFKHPFVILHLSYIIQNTQLRFVDGNYFTGSKIGEDIISASLEIKCESTRLVSKMKSGSEELYHLDITPTISFKIDEPEDYIIVESCLRESMNIYSHEGYTERFLQRIINDATIMLFKQELLKNRDLKQKLFTNSFGLRIEPADNIHEVLSILEKVLSTINEKDFKDLLEIKSFTDERYFSRDKDSVYDSLKLGYGVKLEEVFEKELKFFNYPFTSLTSIKSPQSL